MCRHSERSIYPDQHGIRVLASTEGEELLPSHLSLSSFVLRAPLVLACCVTAVGRRGVHHHMGNVTASIQQEKSTQVEEEMGLWLWPGLWAPLQSFSVCAAHRLRSPKSVLFHPYLPGATSVIVPDRTWVWCSGPGNVPSLPGSGSQPRRVCCMAQSRSSCRTFWCNPARMCHTRHRACTGWLDWEKDRERNKQALRQWTQNQTVPVCVSTDDFCWCWGSQ